MSLSSLCGVRTGPCYSPDTLMCDNIQNIANQESSPTYLEFLLSFHYVGVVEWIDHFNLIFNIIIYM